MNYIFTTIILACLIASTSTVYAQGSFFQPASQLDTILTGEYRGSLVDAQGLRHQLTIRIRGYADGRCEAVFDVSDMQIQNRPFNTTSNESGRILLVNDLLDATFEGNHLPAMSAIDGTWRQARTQSPVRLTKTVSVTRSQEPGANVNYVRREVSSNNRMTGISTTGTLTIPVGSVDFPLIVFVSDRGTQDRDATDQTGHRPFLVMSDYFARNQWASFRMDDRPANSAGEQPSDVEQATELIAMLDRLRTEKNIDLKRIVLLGHGEGGIVAMKAAAKRPSMVQALVLASTPAVSGDRLFPAMVQESERLYGTDDEVIAQAVDLVNAWLSVVKSTPVTDDAITKLGATTDSVLSMHEELLLRYPAAVRLKSPDRDVYIRNNLLPMLRSYAQLEPDADISAITAPCLILVAERDATVPAGINLPAWQSRDLPPGSDVRMIVGVNHGFQSCFECTMEESQRSPETVKPEVLADIVQWLKTRVK